MRHRILRRACVVSIGIHRSHGFCSTLPFSQPDFCCQLYSTIKKDRVAKPPSFCPDVFRLESRLHVGRSDTQLSPDQCVLPFGLERGSKIAWLSDGMFERIGSFSLRCKDPMFANNARQRHQLVKAKSCVWLWKVMRPECYHVQAVPSRL